MKKRILSRDGFTLAESIIAMVIISLVTVTAVTLILSSTHTTQSAVQKAQAQYFAEDALTCFRAADSADRFVDAIAFSGGYIKNAVVLACQRLAMKNGKCQITQQDLLDAAQTQRTSQLERLTERVVPST